MRVKEGLELGIVGKAHQKICQFYIIKLQIIGLIVRSFTQQIIQEKSMISELFLKTTIHIKNLILLEQSGPQKLIEFLYYFQFYGFQITALKLSKNFPETIQFRLYQIQQSFCLIFLTHELSQQNKMFTGKSMDFNKYCGQMTESIDYLDSSIGDQAPIYKNNLPSFRTFSKALQNCLSERDLTEAMSIEEELIHGGQNTQKYKCYRCFGTGRQLKVINGQADPCSECEGTELIPQNHGLVGVLERVLALKLPGLSAKTDTKAWPFYDSRKSIQEEEGSFSYLDENIKECQQCFREFEVYRMYSCSVCPNVQFCIQCYGKGRNHHPLDHTFTSGASRIAVRLPSNPPTMKRISQELQSEEASHCPDSCQLPLQCHNCGNSIQECYEACLDCEQAGGNYTICAECSEHQHYRHNQRHTLAMRTPSLSSKLLVLSAKPSATQSQITQPTPSKSRIRTKQSLVNFDNFNFDDQQEENLPTYSQFFSGFEPQQKSAAPSQWPSQDLGKLLTKKKTKIQQSVVNIDMQCSIQIPLPQAEFQPTLTPYIFEGASQPAFMSLRTKAEPNPEEFVFNGYQCDICKAFPIKNKRYHCEECEDYDLCEMCYTVRSKRHQHSNYQCVDGLQILRKQREALIGRNSIATSKISAPKSVSSSRISLASTSRGELFQRMN